MDNHRDKYDTSHRKNYIKRTLKLGQKALKVKKFAVKVEKVSFTSLLICRPNRTH
jgi:hypothetical protein